MDTGAIFTLWKVAFRIFSFELYTNIQLEIILSLVNNTLNYSLFKSKNI